MKRLFQTLAAALMLLSSATFCSCSDEDLIDTGLYNDEVNLGNDENILAIKRFFLQTFPCGERDNANYQEWQNYKGEDPFITYKAIAPGPQNEQSCTCAILNSAEDLEAIYSGNVEIPDIDFSKISIIIGQASVPYAGVYKFDRLDVKNSKDKTSVTACFSLTSQKVNYAYCAQGQHTFYKIVPKFTPGKKVEAKTSCPNLPWE